VTAGASTFLVLSLDGEPGERKRLTAQLFAASGNAIGGPIGGPILLGDRISPEVMRPITAAFHDGVYIIPTQDFEVVEVDRPCCPTCSVVQPPACVIDDYHVFLVRLSEDGVASAPEILDGRRDAGTHVPLVASGGDGAYLMWDHFIARATATDTPAPSAWVELVFPDDGGLISREYHDVAAQTGEVMLVGRVRDLAVSPSLERAFAARVRMR
jgi:hypothetical protein